MDLQQGELLTILPVSAQPRVQSNVGHLNL